MESHLDVAISCVLKTLASGIQNETDLLFDFASKALPNCFSHSNSANSVQADLLMFLIARYVFKNHQELCNHHLGFMMKYLYRNLHHVHERHGHVDQVMYVDMLILHNKVILQRDYEGFEDLWRIVLLFAEYERGFKLKNGIYDEFVEWRYVLVIQLFIDATKGRSLEEGDAMFEWFKVARAASMRAIMKQEDCALDYCIAVSRRADMYTNDTSAYTKYFWRMASRIDREEV